MASCVHRNIMTFVNVWCEINYQFALSSSFCSSPAVFLQRFLLTVTLLCQLLLYTKEISFVFSAATTVVRQKLRSAKTMNKSLKSERLKNRHSVLRKFDNSKSKNKRFQNASNWTKPTIVFKLVFLRRLRYSCRRWKETTLVVVVVVIVVSVVVVLGDLVRKVHVVDRDRGKLHYDGVVTVRTVVRNL